MQGSFIAEYNTPMNLTQEMIEENSRAMQIPTHIYVKVATLAFMECLRDMDVLEKAVVDLDVKTIQFISHRMKGTLGNVRLDTYAGLAAQVNDAVKKGESIDNIRELFVQFKVAFETMKGK
jgi:HPt (histidine-containing phosphotransfer) domain-containing protein